MSKFEPLVKLIKDSGMFDAEWYLREYPDVKSVNMDPIEHYAWIGSRMGRNPSPVFDMAYYLKKYPKVAEAKVIPLVHYIKHGKEKSFVTAPPESERAKNFSTQVAFGNPEMEEELKQENELLLLQLHQVQEELEKYYLKYQELKNKKD